MHLSRPLTLGHVTLKNRLAKAAMFEGIAARGGAPSQGLLKLYERWAQGGVGLSITGNVMIDERAVGDVGTVNVEDERFLPQLELWARAAQQDGTAAFVQLNHPGRQAPRHVNREVVAPSAVPMRGMPGVFAKPRALEAHEITDIIERFARTAAIVKRAGFAGVQIHGAHGYLVSQFLSPLTNQRTDGWGGSADARSRFLREVVRKVRGAVGPHYPISVKLNSADFQRGGFSEDESMAVVDMLEAEGIDLLEISGGTYESAAMMNEAPRHQSSVAREAFFLAYAERVRARTKLPIMLTGGFRTRDGMEQALASGAVDLIGLARPLALEPDLCTRLLQGQAEQAISVSLATGQKLLDTFMQNAWYRAQLERISQGLSPKPALARPWAALAAVRRSPQLPIVVAT